jgi:uncharacterized protein (TIGR02246 family)
MAQCFDDDGEMIGFDGSHARGPREIADHLKAVFADHETATFVTKVKTAGELCPGVALLRAAAGMVPPGSSDINPAVNTHHTIVATKKNGWVIVLFQNTPAQFHGRPELTEAWSEELRELL